MSKTRVAMITTYNPGAAGPRYVAGQLHQAGHHVKFFHFKELRTVAFPTDDFETHKKLFNKQRDVHYLRFQAPGEVLYIPYPTEITDVEYDLLIQELEKYDPQIIGLSMFTVTVELCRKITELLHERLSGIPVIWGGLHCMVHPEDCLKKLRPDPETGETNPLQVPDILCTTEGEIPMVQLMDNWDVYLAGENPNIPGLWYVRNGNVTKIPRESFEPDLDKYAFPIYAKKEVLIDDNRLDYKLEVKGGFITHHIFVFTERGCPYKCSFCIHSVINKMDKQYQRIRRRSVDKVIAEVMLRVEEHNMKHFILHDEIFAIQKPWILEFAAKWKEKLKPYGVTFSGYLHPIATDAEMIDVLHDAGLTETGVAIQTGSPKTAREMYNRPVMNDKLKAIMEIMSRYQWKRLYVDIITDSPYETFDDRMMTLDLLTDFPPPFDIQSFSLTMYSTTELINKKPLMDEVPWNERLFFNMLFHLCGIPNISKDTIMSLAKDTYLLENPLTLEKLVVDVNQRFRVNRGFLRPSKEQQELGDTGMFLDMLDNPEQNWNGFLEAVPEIHEQEGELFTGYRFKRLYKLKGKIKSSIFRRQD